MEYEPEFRPLHLPPPPPVQSVAPPNDEVRQLVKQVVDARIERLGRARATERLERIRAALQRQGHDVSVEVIKGVIDGL